MATEQPSTTVGVQEGAEKIRRMVMSGSVNTPDKVNEFLEWMEIRLEHHNKSYKEAKLANRDYGFLKSERTECEVCLTNFKSIFGLKF